MIRIDKTFTFDLARGDYPLEPIMKGKTLVILNARGEFGFGPAGVREDMKHLETHIRACAHYLCVEESHLIAIDYQEFGGERHEQSVKAAYAAVPVLVDHSSYRPAGKGPLRNKALRGADFKQPIHFLQPIAKDSYAV